MTKHTAGSAGTLASPVSWYNLCMSDTKSTPAHILIIEDDASINEIVASFLSKKGLECTQAYSGSEAKLVLEGRLKAFDLVITDLMLPGLTGQDLVKLIRQEQHVPIIVTSALDTPKQKVDLFDLGADDYLTKPFDLHELYSRVAVQLRHAQRIKAVSVTEHETSAIGETGLVARSEGDVCADRDAIEDALTDTAPLSDETILIFREWTLKPESRQFLVSGKPLKLTRIEYNIVETLIRRPSKVFTKQELFELAWSEECYIEEKAINVHISNIRSKLKESQTHEYIETVWGIGFRLVNE